ncbi:hypothetical protein NFO65_18625 [Neorhizobium galegae]|uniref:hypothetical protein n=1 Tax=Neorhizobium galegae TaxID=399 RepID=UPI002100993B|nr:hypothetical protein [Neorhizobium galegae]MCQ1572747.1 hypothetical protein [Neorhizobium galegae]
MLSFGGRWCAAGQNVFSFQCRVGKKPTGLSCSLQELTFSDWLGLAGIILSLLGFGVSLWQLWKVKTAAESARDSAKLATEGVRKLDSVISFTSVIKSLDDIKNALHKQDYTELVKQFDSSRHSLIDARENHPGLSDNQRRSIQKALTFLKTLEVEVRTSDVESIKLQHPKFMKTLLEISDSVTTILISTRNMEATGDT